MGFWPDILSSLDVSVGRDAKETFPEKSSLPLKNVFRQTLEKKVSPGRLGYKKCFRKVSFEKRLFFVFSLPSYSVLLSKDDEKSVFSGFKKRENTFCFSKNTSLTQGLFNKTAQKCH